MSALQAICTAFLAVHLFCGVHVGSLTGEALARPGASRAVGTTHVATASTGVVHQWIVAFAASVKIGASRTAFTAVFTVTIDSLSQEHVRLGARSAGVTFRACCAVSIAQPAHSLVKVLRGLAFCARASLIELNASSTSSEASVLLDEHLVWRAATQAAVGGTTSVTIFTALDADTLVVEQTFLTFCALVRPCTKITAFITGLTLVSVSVHVGSLTGGALVILCARIAIGTTHSASSFVVVLQGVSTSCALGVKSTCATRTVGVAVEAASIVDVHRGAITRLTSSARSAFGTALATVEAVSS